MRLQENSKPKVGIVLLRAEWFDSVVGLPELSKALGTDLEATLNFLNQGMSVSNYWVVNSAESLEKCKSEVRTAQVDLIILLFQVWAEDFYLQPLVQAFGDIPIAVWCYLPWTHPPKYLSFVEVLRSSGPVGTFEGLGTLRNLDANFTFTVGGINDQRVLQDLMTAAQSARVYQLLHSARFGLLPSRNEQMQSTFVDEFRLTNKIGPSVIMLSIGELMQEIENVPDDKIETYLNQLQEMYPVRNVSIDTLAYAAKAALGLANLAITNKVDLLSLNDISDELHRVVGLRPCLYPPILYEKETLIGLEGDLGAATSMFILSKLSKSPVFFVEIWYWNESENTVIGGHAGVQDPRLGEQGKVWISHDYEFIQSDRLEGAHFQFVAKPGKVTLFQLRSTPTGWQGILTTGEAIETKPLLEGYPHGAFRLDVPVETFVRRVAKVGSTQHWIVAYGDFSKPIINLCKLLHIPLEQIT